ncbi:VPS39-like protein [Mya arenaria]|uniref:VPS39-like protein n=1 Tax=Mya arenaria TaxID=6604 RepID=A0ABY7FBJ4_MYAAR|nr:VPS39-like protein [Mya arenaria]
MHDAYEAGTILERLPLKIESIACYDEVLLVGTKDGPLLKYTVKKIRIGADVKYEVALEKSYKSFSKKPIQQLCAVPELFLLISLSDSVVSVHDLTSFTPITTLAKTRGASLFATHVQNHISMSGDKQTTLKMCVANRRKIHLMYWKNRDFTDMDADLSVYDIPRSIVWCKEKLCVGFKRDYYILKVGTGDPKELFPLGSKQPEPVISPFKDDGFILGRDDQSIFVDNDGTPTKKHPVKWTDIPVSIVHETPYLIALLSKVIEVRTIEPHLMIQSINLQNARCICQGNGQLYVASSNHVWRLSAVPISTQIRQLLGNKEFELALQLANMTDEPERDKKVRIDHIQQLYAVNLFCKKEFEKSMNIFVKLDTDPSHVIGLFPNLLPPDFRKSLDYPEKLPDLQGGDLEKGLLALTDYLNDEGNKLVVSKEQLSQIIDTTLMKCYLQTNDALVASLLRLKDNKVHVEEAERSLKKKEKYSELIILYEKKGLHEKALNTLMKQATRPNSLLHGCDRTVQYLQHLGPDHLKLIFEYAEWVIRENPEEGIKIFTEDLPEVENLPRQLVLEYLENIDRNNKDLAIKYLEHVIYMWNDNSEGMHSRFAHLLREKVQRYMPEYLAQLPEGHMPCKAGKEVGELGEYRTKLINFLQTSTFYRPEELLPRFKMTDPILAEEYCRTYYKKGKPGDKDVYLEPPDHSVLGLPAFKDGQKPKPNIEEALRIMEEHAGCIDTTRALELLPADTRIVDILTFLENVLELKAATKNKNRVHEQRMFYEKEKVVITDLKSCMVCKKRIGNRYKQLVITDLKTSMVGKKHIGNRYKQLVITDLKTSMVGKKHIGNRYKQLVITDLKAVWWARNTLETGTNSLLLLISKAVWWARNPLETGTNSFFFARYPNGVIVHYGCCKDPKVPPGEAVLDIPTSMK